MKKQLVRITLLILSVTLLSSVTSGCTLFSPIVGKWQDTKSELRVEFTRGGDIIFETNGVLIAGKYELVGEDVVKFSLEGAIGSMVNQFGRNTWKYNVSEDTLTIQGFNFDGSSMVLKRIKISTIEDSKPTSSKQLTTSSLIDTHHHRG